MINPPPESLPGPLLPQRSPSLIQRIAYLFNRNQPNTGPQAADKQGTSTGFQNADIRGQSLFGRAFDHAFKIDTDRRTIYDQVEEMDNASEEASIALDIIANNVCTSEDGKQMSWQIHTDDEEVQKIFDDTIKVSKLHQKTMPLVRNLVKYGDSFAEPTVNSNGEISDLKQLPPKSMYRNETPVGGFMMGEPKYDGVTCINKPGECAFEQRDPSSDTLIAAFWPWQVMHLRLNHDGFSSYGRSHFRVARVTYRKLKAVEESLIVGRLTREYLKLIFYIDTTGLSKTEKKIALREFQNNVTQRIAVNGRSENPFSVMTDFFISTGWIKIGNQVQPSKSSVDVLDPKNVGIHEITDVEYLHRKYIATLRVPPAHLGFEKDVNAKATLTLQDTQFVRFLRNVQQQVGQGLEQIFNLVLILHNYDPDQVKYEITWPQLSSTDQMNAAQSELWRAQVDQLYAGIDAIDAEWIQIHRLELSPEEIIAINKRIQAIKQIEEQKQAQQMQQKADLQNQTAEIAHTRQIELLKAKGQANGFNKKERVSSSNGTE